MRLFSHNAIALIAGLSFTLVASTSLAGGKVMITTYAKDFEIVNGNVGCPKGGGKPAFAVNWLKLLDRMPEDKMDQLDRLISAFESRHGVQVESKTKTKDFEVVSDTIRTESVGPYDGVGEQLCDLIRPYI